MGGEARVGFGCAGYSVQFAVGTSGSPGDIEDDLVAFTCGKYAALSLGCSM